MKPLVEESQTLIQAPIQAVWEALSRFEDWPTWSSQIKEVREVSQGWRFRTHGVELVDQVGVVRPKPSSQPYRLEWESVRDQPHNLITRGWIGLEPTPLGTRLTAHVEFEPDYPSPLVDYLADLWALAFAEPSKFLNATLNDFRAYVERRAPVGPGQPQPSVLAWPAV
ncbi:MAG: SRPBCC family protein [Thermaceae bacterium]|nr:SRPBCC family protein [Thermaceae bacterium]